MSVVEDNDKGFAAVLKELKALSELKVTVGIHSTEGAHMAYIAGLHEFGSAEWIVTRKQAYYMARFLFKINPDDPSQKARFWGTVHKLTGKKMKIPERSFLRSTFDHKQATLNEYLLRVYDAVAAGDLTAKKGLGLFAVKAEAVFQQGLLDVKSPANAPLTVAIKKSDQPLVDHGRLRAAIKAKVTARALPEATT